METIIFREIKKNEMIVSDNKIMESEDNKNNQEQDTASSELSNGENFKNIKKDDFENEARILISEFDILMKKSELFEQEVLNFLTRQELNVPGI